MMDKIFKYIEKFHMIEKGDTVIAGISGGADSVCLFFVLLELRRLMGINIVAVHVNHGIRGDAAKSDEDFTVRLCEAHGVKCAVYHENVEQIAKTRKQSVEEAGRNVRRAAFEETFKKEKGTKIATAHHQNDNAETFLMNLVRGAGLRGLTGILPVNGAVIRPLLCLTRKEIEEYVTGIGCGWCSDATNDEEDYTRNRLRRRVIPFLEERVNAAAVTHINAAAEQVRQAMKYMEYQVGTAMEKCVSVLPNQDIVIKQKIFEGYHETIKGMIAMRALEQAAGARKDLGAVHVGELISLFDRQCGRSIDLPYRVRADKIYEGVLLHKRQDKEEVIYGIKSAPTVLNVPGRTFLPEKKMTVCSKIFEKTEEFSKDKIPKRLYTKWFDYDIIKGSLCIRCKEQGDSIAIDESGGSQKLKSYFINEKIPAEKRGAIPLLADDDKILWIIGYRINAKCKVTEKTKKILEIRLLEEEKDGGKD